MSFVPISIDEYVKRHVKSNPDENAVDFQKRLRECVVAALSGEACSYGEPIWVIGSAVAGHACFTCITGEATPSEDYEINEVLHARNVA